MELIQPTEIFGLRDPPEEGPKEQYLFLLELFVHQVTGERLAKLNRMFFVPTRISFKFLDFESEDIAVTPVDVAFEPQAGFADDVERFNAGKSVMFALAKDLVERRQLEMKINMVIEKKMPETIKPDILVGVGEIDMSERFAALRKEMLQCWHTNYPPPKSFEGEVELSFEGQSSGSCSIYARISGFGQSIVTEIEAPRKDASGEFVFKSQEREENEQLAYECRRVDRWKIDKNGDSVEKLRDGTNCQVCRGERHTCSPCGKRGAGRRDRDPRVEGAEREGIGGDGEETLKRILSGKPLVAPWKPAGCLREESGARSVPIQSSRGPAEPCGKAVVLKVSGLLDVEDAEGRRKQPTVTVAGESEDQRNDEEHDVFILRIGKKGLVGAGEKSDIQLEMRTPKGPERRPPIRYETREIQTEEEMKGKPKGKGGKGKGKGKGKKKGK